jgi:hypothetical protein
MEGGYKKVGQILNKRGGGSSNKTKKMETYQFIEPPLSDFAVNPSLK